LKASARRLVATRETFPLARPFRIARGVKTAAEVVTVRIAQGEAEGWGEGVPYPRYGESPEAALAAIAAVRPAIEAGACRAQLMELLPPGAARNAIDCALIDLEARRAGCTAAALAGLAEPGRVATALTVGIDTPAAMARAAARLREAPVLKVKLDAEAPEDRLRAVRAEAPGPRLILDPNESWTMAMVERMQPLLRELDCDLLEQPLPADADAALEGFRPLVPICADEAVHGIADLARLAGRYQAINVKLDKTGGLTAALALASAARAAGFGVMVGCMICSSLSVAPALLLAGGADFVDLDGPAWLARDRAGGIALASGWIEPARPGFWGRSGSRPPAAAVPPPAAGLPAAVVPPPAAA
jgi:L-alanine-DL-glutamate epimerase-like enolase superfamily enzyme